MKTEPTSSSTTEGGSDTFDCDFEDSECGWSDGCEDPEFCWKRTIQDTCSETHLDCPEDTEGYYMYVDGAKGNKELKAQLMSPGGATPTDDCFLFSYNFHVSPHLCTKFLMPSYPE